MPSYSGLLLFLESLACSGKSFYYQLPGNCYQQHRDQRN
jgi:hypothetical protein